MSSRISALSTILRSPVRILALVLSLVFFAEVAVMLVLPFITPVVMDEALRAILDAFLLTMVCAPALWLVIIGPLRQIAIQEHQRSETIVANASESILTFNRYGAILSYNRPTLDLLAVTATQLIGKPIQATIPDLPNELENLPIGLRLTAVRSNGESFPIQVSVSEYPSEAQFIRIAILRDLTWSEQAEKERLERVRETEALRAQQMATLAQLATGVAHEIRNPLTSIKMLIQVNLASFEKAGLPTADLELVQYEIRRMERSINSLLEYALQNIELCMDGPENPLKIIGDAAQIQQLLLNLSLNALDAMPSSGRLNIAVATQDSLLRIAVRDTGAGIQPAMLDQLFTPFSTTKPNGVGLGLGICRRIADAHHGTLIGCNQPEGGAEFVLTIPIAITNAIGPSKSSSISESANSTA